MQSALSKSFSKTVPTGTPIASGKATEVDSWHMFELSGKLFVPYMTSEMHFPEDCIADSLAALAKHQVLNHQTHATHAAAFYVPKGNLIIREDVGRHNALDKLAGALSLRNIDPAQGAIVITSRVSVEMVQKAARIGAPLLIAISAPTGLAVQTAERANITLVALARGHSYQLFSHGDRIER